MRISIRGQHMEVTEALRDYVEKKLSRLERYFETPPTAEGHATLSTVKGLQTVEVTIPFPGMLLRAEEKSTDMYASIDLVVDKLERQIRKNKTKVNRRFREEAGIRDLFRVDTSKYQDEEDEAEVVRTKQFPLKPMDVEEAILQMNMIGHSFFVFANMDTKKISVVYKRNDGKYGLIEPAM